MRVKFSIATYYFVFMVDKSLKHGTFIRKILTIGLPHCMKCCNVWDATIFLVYFKHISLWHRLIPLFYERAPGLNNQDSLQIFGSNFIRKVLNSSFAITIIFKAHSNLQQPSVDSAVDCVNADILIFYLSAETKTVHCGIRRLLGQVWRSLKEYRTSRFILTGQSINEEALQVRNAFVSKAKKWIQVATATTRMTINDVFCVASEEL